MSTENMEEVLRHLSKPRSTQEAPLEVNAGTGKYVINCVLDVERINDGCVTLRATVHSWSGKQTVGTFAMRVGETLTLNCPIEISY